MSAVKTKFQTPLARAKGHGAAHSGVATWWAERVTSAALAILLPWFVASLVAAMLSSDVSQVAGWFALPVNAVGMLALVAIMFWHMKLGMQVIIEDYVHVNFWKYTLLFLNAAVCYGFMILGLICVLRLHFIDITSFGA